MGTLMKKISFRILSGCDEESITATVMNKLNALLQQRLQQDVEALTHVSEAFKKDIHAGIISGIADAEAGRVSECIKNTSMT